MIRRWFCFLLAAALLSSGALAQPLPDMNEMVRLHVVARDDSEAAQALKMEIRAVCLRCARVCMGDASGGDDAYMRLQNHLDDFRTACEMRMRELGCEDEITVETGRFFFPDRWYGDMHVPRGEYRALRITIGEGEGHNWWCVLYPTLCGINEADAAGDEVPTYARVMNWLRAGLGGLK